MLPSREHGRVHGMPLFTQPVPQVSVWGLGFRIWDLEFLGWMMMMDVFEPVLQLKVACC